MSAPGLQLPARLAARATIRVRDLVDAFGFSKPLLHAAIKAGRLKAFKLDGVILLDRVSVEEYLASAKPVTK